MNVFKRPRKKTVKIVDQDYYDRTNYHDRRPRDLGDIATPFQEYRISKVLELYTPQKNEKVLDLGSGFGTFTFTFAPLCRNIAGIDFSRKSIDLCKRMLKEKSSQNVSFICADAKNTGLKSGFYDVIICADLVEHLYPDDFSRVLCECKRLLKKKGKLVIWTPNGGHFFEMLRRNNIILKKFESHVDYKSMATLRQNLIFNNFKILKCYYTESHFPILKILETKLMAFLPILRRRIAILAEKT